MVKASRTAARAPRSRLGKVENLQASRSATAAAALPFQPSPAEQVPPHDLDRALHVFLAQITQGLSPAAVAGAWADWALHLAFSPGKQMELGVKAARKTARLAHHALHRPDLARDPCIEPLPQDKRFAAPEWQQWPFNLLYQAFLLNQQWWHNATTGVRGVSRHHEEMVTFGARQQLDMLSPSNFPLCNPEVMAETCRTAGMNLWQGALNWADDAWRLATRQPPAGTERFRPGREVALTPGKVVLRNRLIELIQYTPQTADVWAEPILIVPSWILKYYILDLSPANSLVRWLVEQGHTVFMVSWRNPDSADREIGMDDYLHNGVMAALDAVWTIVPRRPIQAVGYCLGGTLLAIAAAAMARDGDERLNTLSLLASQVDFSEPGELGLFIDESQLAFLDDVMSSQGTLDGKQMSGAFALLGSRDLVFSRMVRDYLMGRRAPVSDLAAWNADATRMPFHQHSHYLRSLYLRNDLAQNRYRVAGVPVALTDIRVPIFSLGTERDTVSPWPSVYKINTLSDTDVTFCLTSGGHNVGVVNPPGPGVKRHFRIATRPADGRYTDPQAWQAQAQPQDGSWWPAWGAWLREHASARVKPPAMGSAAHGYAQLDDAPGRFVLTP